MCGQDECKINNGGCQQECVDTSDGFFCKCQPGYKLVSNTTCQDIDECETPGTCSQMCINRPGTFKCDCLPGYEKEPTDHARCKATHGDRRLIFAQKTDIRMIWLDLQMTVPVVAKTRSSCALDFHYQQKKIFYTDIITQKIYSVNFDGTNQTELLSDMIVTPDGLAVDWVYQRLYWTDTGTNSISSININGDTGTLINIVKDDLEEPRAITLHPGKGLIFWTDWGMYPKIERASMDGSERKILHTAGVRWPNGLTIDLVSDRLYWVDAKLHTVSSSNIDGSDARIVLYSSVYVKHPFSITVFEDQMYWSEWISHNIYQADKFHGRNVSPVNKYPLAGVPMVIQLMHPHRQPQYSNLCSPDNGHCSHTCLPATHGRVTCHCPPHLTLSQDIKTCQDQNKLTTASNEAVTPVEAVSTAAHVVTEAVPVTNNVDAVGATVGMLLLLIVIVTIGLLFLYRRSYAQKQGITVKFNNPTFQLTSSNSLPSHPGPMYLDRHTSASLIDLRSNI